MLDEKQLNKRIAIIGHENAIVGQLLKKLQDQDYISNLVSINETLTPIPVKKLTAVRQSIDSPYYTILRRHRVNTIIHMGLYNSLDVPSKLLPDLSDRNDKVIDSLLDSCENSDIDHLVFISSSCIYHSAPVDWASVSESDVHESEKGLSLGLDHYKAEQKLRQYANNNSHIAVTILRPSSVLGPSSNRIMCLESVSWNTVSIKNGFPLQFMHEYDFIDAIDKTVESIPIGVFNIASAGVIYPAEIKKIIGKKIISIPRSFPYFLVKWLIRFISFHNIKDFQWKSLMYPVVMSTVKFTNETAFQPMFNSNDAVTDYIYSNIIMKEEVEIIYDGK
jgi:UDP-glucose 4-epimerase